MSEAVLAAPTRRPYLLMSIVLHALLGACLYYFGSYQLELRRQDEQVAASVQAATRVRSARRVEDLQKIKELLEQSAAGRGDEAAQAKPGAAEPAPPKPPEAAPAQLEPQQMLEQARQLSREIEDISRDIQAEELARLTGKPKDEARAEIDAAAPPQPESQSADPFKEIARLEAQARAVLAKRGEQLEREQNGVEVSSSKEPAGAGTSGIPGPSGAGGGHQAQLAAQIAQFVRDGAGTPDPQERRTKGSYGPVFDRGAGSIPGVRAGHMVKGKGRMLGAGGQYANRLYLNSWYVIGPFEGRGGRNLLKNPKHPPEDAVLLGAVYHGKDKRLVSWEYVSEATYPLVPRDPAENAVYYGYTEVLMDEERDLTMWVGADDDVRIWLNDRVVWAGGNEAKQWFFDTLWTTRAAHDRDFNRTEGQQTVRFKKGRNRIFFKLSNGPNDVFFSLVLTQPGVR